MFFCTFWKEETVYSSRSHWICFDFSVNSSQIGPRSDLYTLRPLRMYCAPIIGASSQKFPGSFTSQRPLCKVSSCLLSSTPTENLFKLRSQLLSYSLCGCTLQSISHKVNLTALELVTGKNWIPRFSESPSNLQLALHHEALEGWAILEIHSS